SPENGPVNGFAAASMMPEVLERSRPSRPSPGPVVAVTVLVVPDPVTLLMDAPAAALPDSEKFDAPTPVTASENVTVHETLAAFVGFASATVIDDTVGGMLSLCGML